jgi:Protein kinase domain
LTYQDYSKNSQIHVFFSCAGPGLGAVYLARDEKGNAVALKEIPRSNADDAALARFRQEIRVGRKLVHPNVIRILDVGPRDAYFTMEYFYSRPFDAWRREDRPNDRQVLDVIRQVLAGLQYAHESDRVVHRDLNPPNILVGIDNTNLAVKIIDFGFARAGAEEGSRITIGALGAFGTFPYTPPVLFSSGAMMNADIRDDLFSLGCVLFEALSDGTRPFSVAWVERHESLKNGPKSLAALRSDLPAGLPEVVEKLLRYDAAERYQEPKEVLAMLEQFRDGSWGSSSAGGETPRQRAVALPSTASYIATDPDRPSAPAAPADLQAVFDTARTEARQVLRATVQRLRRMLIELREKPFPTIQRCIEFAAEEFFRFDGGVEGLLERCRAWPRHQYRLQKGREEMALLRSECQKFRYRAATLEEFDGQQAPTEVLTAFSHLVESRIAALNPLCEETDNSLDG